MPQDLSIIDPTWKWKLQSHSFLHMIYQKVEVDHFHDSQSVIPSVVP